MARGGSPDGCVPFGGPRGDHVPRPKNQAMVASLAQCRAGAVIVDSALPLPEGMNAIRVDPPHLGLAKVLDLLYPRRRAALGSRPPRTSARTR